MKRATPTILLALLWLMIAVAYQPQSRSYAQPSAPIHLSAIHRSIESRTAPTDPLEPPPLGSLRPITGLLPSGTVSFTLGLTTTAQANCRWSDTPNTPFSSMSNDFETGQGDVSHSTLISDVNDLADRRFYVRCQDVPPGRDPDSYQVQTHMRVLGPWSSDFPHIANLWNNFSTNPGADFVAGFDLHVVFGGPSRASQAYAIRTANPNAKILLTVHATYGVPGINSPATEWWFSQPGDPDYNCLLRNTQGAILLVAYWGHPMYNMTVPYCRTLLAQMSIDAFLSPDQNWGADLAYDGLYWDRLHDTINWLSPNIDSNLDGQPDSPAQVNAAYQAGIEDFLTQVRARLPNAILMGNDAGLVYAPWINGRYFETQLAALLDGGNPANWPNVMQNYQTWAGSSVAPRTTFIANAPELFYSSKYTFLHVSQMPPAMRAETAASYSRMRYGLATALMGNGLFSYDYGPDSHGDRWWYDEYGRPGGPGANLPPTNTLPPRGYLSQPVGAPEIVDSLPHTIDQVVNGSFDNGLDNWSGFVDPNSPAQATFDVDATGGADGSPAAHVVISNSHSADLVDLRQLNLATVANRQYTVSFWGRSLMTHTIDVQLIVDPTPWISTGFNVQATLTPDWQLFRLTDAALRTRSDLRLVFQLGSQSDEVWLDGIQFQEGVEGVWARPFQNGLALINTTDVAQTVLLPDYYRKLNGSQAPLFQVRVDDDEAAASGSWVQSPANYSQFGTTIHTANSPNPSATMTYAPDLIYSGTYQVLAWVVPTITQSSAVSITIQHADGATEVALDETQGEIGWHDLGTYRFDAGSAGHATLAATGNGLVVADALKWVSTARYNDGQLVAEVTLEPNDAIILQKANRVFLPTILSSVP